MQQAVFVGGMPRIAPQQELDAKAREIVARLEVWKKKTLEVKKNAKL